MFRLILLLPLVFLIGVFWERYNAGERCTAQGGTWQNNLCWSDL